MSGLTGYLCAILAAAPSPLRAAPAAVQSARTYGRIPVWNAAIVPAGSNGAACVYASDPTDSSLDNDGCFVSLQSVSIQ
jgi:hypothetical protein